MFIYLACSTYGSPVINDLKYPNILVAFPYAKTFEAFNYLPNKVICDSGAFTAWSIGGEVDIKAYKDWALDRQRLYGQFIAVNLDVIPGEAGRTSTLQEREEGMQQSLLNADYLRSNGVNVMEVFHQDEPLEFFDKLYERLPADGILGISPRNDVSVNRKRNFQKQVLAHILKRYGKKNIPKMHGLAVTSRVMLEEFPYYSTDSSTYASSGRFGTFINEKGKMQPVTDLLPSTVRGSGQPAMLMVRKSIENLQMLERSITNLWAERGIKW